MLETKSLVAEIIKNTDGVEIKIDSAALVSWLFLFGSLLFMLDAGVEIIQGISIHSIIHISASLLFTIGSIQYYLYFQEKQQ